MFSYVRTCTRRAVSAVISWFSIGSDICGRVFFLVFFSPPNFSHRTRISNTAHAPVGRVKNVQRYAHTSFLTRYFFLHGFHWPAPWFIALRVEAAVPSLLTDLRRYFVNDASARARNDATTILWPNTRRIPFALREHTPSFRAHRVFHTGTGGQIFKNEYMITNCTTFVWFIKHLP